MMAATMVNVKEGERILGEVEVYTSSDDQNGVVWEREIRISHYSQPSERCPPLSVLLTITSTTSASSSGLCFKLELKDKNQSTHQNSPLSILHGMCLRENKVYLTKKITEIWPAITQKLSSALCCLILT